MPATQSTTLPDHILAAVLTLAKRKLVEKDPKRDRFAFRNYDFELQEVFSQLQKTKEYPILNAFVFADSGPEPYSPALEESVSRLQLSGLIGRENPDYEVVFLQSAADRFFDEVLSTEFATEIEQLKKIASQFLDKVNVVQPA